MMRRFSLRRRALSFWGTAYFCGRKFVMSLQETPSGERIHIGFFGVRNAGKSSLVNAVTGQDLSVVSDVRGTTTDPVRKAMELLPLGPVVIVDTPGFDDEGALGELRVKKTREILGSCDIAILVADGTAGLRQEEETLLTLIRQRRIPYLIVWNKSDLPGTLPAPEGAIHVSCKTGEGVSAFKERLAALAPADKEQAIASDLISPGDFCVLVCPIDESAPKGRLILPQQLTIRDLMDAGAIPVICRDTELAKVLSSLGQRPALVITDSQAFRLVNDTVPEEIPLTSFSILMARYKGFLETAVQGVRAALFLQDGDRVLLAEGCTHHRQCRDIGTVKIPAWLRKFTGKDVLIETCSGRDFPEDLSPYHLVIHCGGCMLTEAMMESRRKQAAAQGVPFTNYGVLIAHITGALERSLRLFPQLHAMIEKGEP